MEFRRHLQARTFFSSIAAMLLAMAIFVLAAPGRTRAQELFDVSATFGDNSSTPLTGTLTINTATGVVDGFYFNIPTMTIGSTTLEGALFTPTTANEGYFINSDWSYITLQLIDAPPEGEELFLEIPQTTLVSYTGGVLLKEVTVGSTVFQTGYQSGAQSNPFINITENGSITPSPEPSSYILFASGLLGLLSFALKKARA